MKRRIERIIDLVERQGLAPRDHLNLQGAGESEIDQFERETGFKLPSDVHEFFRCLNGVDLSSISNFRDCALWPENVFPISILESLGRHQDGSSAYLGIASSLLIRITDNLGGFCSYIDGDRLSGTYGQLFCVDLGLPEPVQLQFQDLQSFLDFTIECYEEGCYGYDQAADCIVSKSWSEQLTIARRHKLILHSEEWGE